VSELKENLAGQEHFNARLLRQEERVLELAQRLDNAVGKLVSLAQLVRASTAANSELLGRVAQLEAQVKNLEERPMALPNLRNEPPPELESIQPQADFGQVVALLKSEEWEQARRTLGRIPARDLQDQPVLLRLVEAVFSVNSNDMAATVRSLEQVQGLVTDPRLAQALQLAAQLRG
jgi:cell division protein FtsB